MYVLVDRGQMAITHKHKNREVLNCLSWIECTNDAITIPLGNPKHFADLFMPNELRRIYQASTGKELAGYGYALAVAVHSMAMRLEANVVNDAEVFAQRHSVMDGDKSSYSYQPGSMAPMQHNGKYTPPALTTEADPNELARAASTATALPPVPPGATGPDRTPVQGNGATHIPAAPKPGGTREIIFRVADTMWEQLGKTADVKKVLEMRKQCMTVLEADHGIKKTTSSTALGDWQKARLT